MEIDVSVPITNRTGKPLAVRVPSGQVFESAQTELGVQNVTIVGDYRFVVPPHATIKITVRGRCLNQLRSAPKMSRGRITPFRYAGPSFAQDAIWAAVASPIGSP